MRLTAALCLAASLAAAPAMAQTRPVSPPPAPGPGGMAVQEWQGLSCLWGGVLGGAGVFYYSDVLTGAVAGSGMGNPLLLVPLVAAGFVAGCSVGTNAAPGLDWLYGHLF